MNIDPGQDWSWIFLCYGSAIRLFPDIHEQLESLARLQIGIASYAIPFDKIIHRYLESPGNTVQ